MKVQITRNGNVERQNEMITKADSEALNTPKVYRNESLERSQKDDKLGNVMIIRKAANNKNGKNGGKKNDKGGRNERNEKRSYEEPKSEQPVADSVMTEQIVADETVEAPKPKVFTVNMSDIVDPDTSESEVVDLPVHISHGNEPNPAPEAVEEPAKSDEPVEQDSEQSEEIDVDESENDESDPQEIDESDDQSHEEVVETKDDEVQVNVNINKQGDEMLKQYGISDADFHEPTDEEKSEYEEKYGHLGEGGFHPMPKKNKNEY